MSGFRAVVGSAPENFDTLQEIAAYIESHKEVADALQAAVGNKANKDEVVYKKKQDGEYRGGWRYPEGICTSNIGDQCCGAFR